VHDFGGLKDAKKLNCRKKTARQNLSKGTNVRAAVTESFNPEARS